MSAPAGDPVSQPTPVRAPRSTVVADPGGLSSFWRPPVDRRHRWMVRLVWLGLVLGLVLALVLAGGFRTRTDRGRERPFTEEYTNGPLRHQWHDAVAAPRGDGAWEVSVHGTCTNVTDEPWAQPYGGPATWAGGSVDAPKDVVVGRVEPDLGPSTFQPGVPTPCTLVFRHTAAFTPEDHYAFQEVDLVLQAADLFGQEAPSWRPSPTGVNHVFFAPLVVRP